MRKISDKMIGVNQARSWLSISGGALQKEVFGLCPTTSEKNFFGTY
jgi:hypothetical protein